MVRIANTSNEVVPTSPGGSSSRSSCAVSVFAGRVISLAKGLNDRTHSVIAPAPLLPIDQEPHVRQSSSSGGLEVDLLEGLRRAVGLKDPLAMEVVWNLTADENGKVSSMAVQIWNENFGQLPDWLPADESVKRVFFSRDPSK